MKVYDFDNTVFRGDSTAKFCIFCFLRRPSLLRFLPVMGAAFLSFSLGRISKTAFKERLYSFFPAVPDMEKYVADFWDKHRCGIKSWYSRQKREDDLIISASPEFLLSPICRELGVSLIASRVDPRTGRYDGENCHGEEKVKRFRLYGALDRDIEEFYSDSLSDTPMARLAKTAFLVKGDRISRWNAE